MKNLLAFCCAAAVAMVLTACQHYQPAPIDAGQIAAGLDARSLADPGLKSFLETNLHRPFAVWPPKEWDFQKLTLVAFYYHPSLDVARAQWAVARAGVQSAGGRPNPTVGVTPGYSFNAASGTSPWFPMLSIDVPLETAGKRGYRVAHAQHLSDAARLNIASAAWTVRASLRASLLDYSSALQRAQLLQQQIQLHQQIVTSLEQRFQAGALARSELTLPRLALAKSGADLADAQRLAAEARVRIADALGLPVKALDGAEFESRPPLSTEAGIELTSTEARQQALLSRPDILAALAEYAASQSAFQLEIAKQYPDIHLGTGYQFDQGEHKWSLGLTAEIPVLNRNQGPIHEARAKRAESAARFVALQAKVLAEIDRALVARTTALEQVTRQNQFVQLTREQATSVEALVKAGAADKLDLASAQLEASATALAQLDAEIKARQAVAQLEDVLQRPLEAWPNLEQGRAVPTTKP